MPDLEQQQKLQEVYRDADDAAIRVICHMDTMYPALWDGVPKTARTSVRNTIASEIRMLLLQENNGS